MNKKSRFLIALCVLLVFSVLFFSLRRAAMAYICSAPRQCSASDLTPAKEYSDAIADAVEKVASSVVVIRTEKIQVRRQELVDMFGFWRYYQWVPEELAGEGSGVIIDDRGYVITSWHVIKGAREVKVVLNDGTRLEAKQVGYDKATDLAILDIKQGGMDFPSIEFGDSDTVRVGEVAIAIGSPFSLQGSVTVGHVSQKGRKIHILPYEDFIQTDAAINEGNSGGPLIDVEGRLIGINTARKTDDQEKGVGIAFSIPSNLAMVIARSIIEKGVHEWPWVGASFYTVDRRLQEKAFGGASVVISRVWNHTPASRAGLQVGTAVLKVDGIPIRTKQDIERIIYNKSVDESVVFLFQYEKKRHEVELFLEEFPGLSG